MISVRLISWFYLIGIICLYSCKSTYSSHSPYGVQSSVTLTSESILESELIAINEDHLYVLVQDNLVALDIEEVASIYTHQLEGKNRKAILIFTGLSAIGLGIAIEDEVITIGSIGLGIYGLVGAFSPRKKYIIVAPFSEKDRERLNLYARYPQGLTEDQLNYLINYYKKD